MAGYVYSYTKVCMAQSPINNMEVTRILAVFGVMTMILPILDVRLRA